MPTHLERRPGRPVGRRAADADWVAQYSCRSRSPPSWRCDPTEELARVETRRLDPSGQFALVAAREAWADAGAPEVEPERLGVVCASGIGGVWTLLSAYDVAARRRAPAGSSR